MLKQLSALLLFSVLSFPQNGDSLKIKSIQTKLDTTITSVSDTVSSIDTSKTIEAAQKDTLVPIQGEPLTDVSTIISKRTFLFENYRYTGDLLRSFSLNFVKDLGFVGYPHETFIYGVGNSGISYLQDGLFINNRFTNSLDLNFVQSEDIDSIEIVPSPRGFLYGPYNNPITVNFITKDFISGKPYSRIKYYEGPDGEGMIDGKFSSKIANRWNLSFQVTNRSKDETYVNTDLSLWQVNTKLKYFLSNSINITGSYYFVSSKQGLNGGVDYDSLTKISDNPASDLYEPFVAPVVYPSRTLDATQHNFRLRTMAKPFDDSRLDFSVYYRYGLDELRDFQDSIDISRDKEKKRFGASLNFYYGFDYITLQVLGDYQKIKTDVHNNYGDSNSEDERYSIAGLISLHTLDKSLKLSIFFKTSDWITPNMGNYQGIGIDIKYVLNNLLSLYAGYSIREEYLNREAPSFEIGTSLRYSGLVIDFKYFSNEYFNYYRYWSGGPEPLQPANFYSPQEVKGLGLNLNYKFWVILFESNFSYYDLNTTRSRDLPDYQFVGGLFVNDLFFDNHLDLKAGLKFYYTGEINSYWQVGTDIEPTNKLDFTLAGEIKKVAIFYFIWENLFGNQYYITPYYPMPERNIRFGLAWELFN